MRKDFRNRLAALEPVAAELNRASDAFSEELKQLEDELRKLNVGIDVTLRPAFYSDRPEMVEKGEHRHVELRYSDYFLAYGKVGSLWRILVREDFVFLDPASMTTDTPDLPGEERPLLESPRELRLAAAERIGALLDLISEEAKKKTEAVMHALDV